ncbi:MAG TPA: C40 family peptidase [Candidatus Limnocylindria bacterium]|nr:C40 family peptidase [Candidatus Limnocylindria bacterium]
MSITPATQVAMVWAPRAIVSRGVTPLRGQPDDAAELVDEAQYGEQMIRLAERGDWAYVQGPDLYFGWIRIAHLTEYRAPQLVIVGAPLARAHATASSEAEVVDELPAGVPIVFRERAGDWWRVGRHPEMYVQVEDTVEVATLPQRYPTADDLLATAEAFLGVPYLWGGTSAHGIDCSGFTQQVYRLNGVGLDRDADQQALGGRPVDQARPGDLFFFGAERVTHTAIATGERTFIHAPQSGMTVQHGELTDQSRLHAIRRYLP